jgi:pyruvate/2-oxoglutarate/acetoin dehydrogenase E1 component
MYKDEITKSMDMLSGIKNTVFIGQGVKYWGNIYGTLNNVPDDKKLELPIIEDTQMGISIGLAIAGFLPITIYPRMDFLLLALNQLVNHLDKFEEMSGGEYSPKVIVRTIIGSKSPLYPGAQHCQDHTKLLHSCLTNIDVIKLTDESDVYSSYLAASVSKKSVVIVEDRSLYESISNR